MKKNIFFLLLLFLSVNVLAINSPSSQDKISKNDYQFCLQQSNKLNNPYDRDQRKISCFRKFNRHLTSNSCTSLAKRLEYSSMSDELLQDCIGYFGNSANDCVKISKSMNYGENRDAGLWSCLNLNAVKNVKKRCLEVANNMIFPHNKNHAIAFCTYQNEN